MAPLNFGNLKTAVQANRFDASQDMARWVISAYEQVWNEAEWSFKKVAPGDAAIVLPTTGKPTMPTDFGRVELLFDDLGEEITALEETEFDRRYREALVAGVTGRPEAFKIVDRQIILGPTPDKAYTGAIGYQRRLSTRTNTGFAKVGAFVSDLDTPFWSWNEGEHHYVVALRAMITGRNFESDLSAQLIMDEYQQALGAMKEEFVVDQGGTRMYGADSL